MQAELNNIRYLIVKNVLSSYRSVTVVSCEADLRILGGCQPCDFVDVTFVFQGAVMKSFIYIQVREMENGDNIINDTKRICK